jgi:hypothetical protein
MYGSLFGHPLQITLVVFWHVNNQMKVFYLLGLSPCFHRDKVVVAAKQAEGSTKRK